MTEESSPKVQGRRWPFACILVGLAAFFMSLSTVGAVSGVGAIGTLVALASAFFVRHLRWKLLLYVPGAYVAALVLSFMLIPVAAQVHGTNDFGGGSGTSDLGGRSGCVGWNRYIGEVNAYSEPLNNRLEDLRDIGNRTDAQIQVVINAFNNDIENWRASDPPPNAEALNDQLIVVLQGWVEIFESIRDGTFTDQMLFDLQVEDDKLERLTRRANAACAD